MHPGYYNNEGMSPTRHPDEFRRRVGRVFSDPPQLAGEGYAAGLEVL